MYRILLFIFLFLPFTTIAQSPNIIFILTDDQGWNGTSELMNPSIPESKSDFYQTPNLEALANEGMVFSNAYAPAPKCSPTRNSILTGQTTAKSAFTNTGSPSIAGRKLIHAPTATSIDNTLETFPELIKENNPNYMTAHYGKWHLYAAGPLNHGFDRGDGNTSNDVGDQGGLIQDDPKRIFQLTDSAMVFINDAIAANRPFYLQLSHYAVHSPNECSQSNFDIYNDPNQRPPGNMHDNTEFGAMTEDLDYSIGMLLDSLNALGLSSNTYIVYMSDNGAANGQSNNGVLAGGKSKLDEGGIRVPLVIKGPGITGNTHCNEPVVGYDLYPTFIDWIFNDVSIVPDNVDGGSLNNILTNNGTGTVLRNNKLIFHNPHYEETNTSIIPQSCIIDGNHKLMVDYEATIDYFKLFDLSTDIGETTNIASSQPAILESLKLELRDYLKDVQAPLPTLNPSHSSNPGSGTDADSDGMDDTWEFRWMLTHNYGATDDPDNDGFDNLTEYNAGKDPYVFNTDMDCKIDFIQPTSAVQGSNGISISISMDGIPLGEVPYEVTIDGWPVSNIERNDNVITGTLNLPPNAPTGLKSLAMEFPTCSVSLSAAFEILAGNNSGNIFYLDKSASGNNSGTDWANAFRNIQVAINAVFNAGGGEIWVKSDTYTPNSASRENNIKIKEGVALYGGFNGTEISRDQRSPATNITILSGDIGVQGDPSDNSYHIIKGFDNSIIDGFTIQDGYADGIRWNRLGAGIYIDDVAPTINNCIFKNNYAEEGAAIYSIGEGATAILSNCTFMDNQADKGGAVSCRVGSHLLIYNCEFNNNTATWRGGGLFIDYGADPVVLSCIFDGNHVTDGNGGAVYIDNNASQLSGTDPIFKNTDFLNNTSTFRGGAISSYERASTTSVFDCNFNNNSCTLGGGAIALDNECTVILRNNTYTGNSGGSGASDIDSPSGTHVTQY